MNRLSGNHLHRWWIPLASCAIFFLIIAFLIPYSQSLYNVKKSLAGLIYALCGFGNTSVKDAPLDFTYCLFVPVISGYLIYMRAQELDQAPIKQGTAGMGIILLG